MSTAAAGYLRGYFDLEETEPVTVNQLPVQALRVIGRGPRTSPIDEAHQQLTPFSGPHEELESLRQTLRSAAGGQGQVIGISGDPGLGKSRLAHELRLAAEEDTVALQGRCLPFGTAVPYLRSSIWCGTRAGSHRKTTVRASPEDQRDARGAASGSGFPSLPPPRTRRHLR